MDETGKADGGCIVRSAGHVKTSSIQVYLQEELGDARLRCDELLRYIDEATRLIEQSPQKDHFFEVAGHLINGVPYVAFKLHKALQAVALAAGRLDYEEIKQDLRPEKVTELENVLKDVRIRPVPRRSEPVMIAPKKAAEKIREIASMTKEDGVLPLDLVAALVGELETGLKEATTDTTVASLEKLAASLENPTGEVQRAHVATLLRRIASEATFVKAALAEDPGVEAHFETIKGLGIVANRTAASGRWRSAMMTLFTIVDTIGTILVHFDSPDASIKAEALKREIRRAIPVAMKKMRSTEPEDEMVMAAGDDDKRSKFEEGKPADPTENMSPEDAKKWKTEHNNNKDNFKAASVWKA